LGEVRQAIKFYEQHLAIAREISDRHGEGRAQGNLGNAYVDLGEVRQAIKFYEQYLAIAREISDRQGEGQALGNLGNAYYHLGEVRQAIDLYGQRLAIAREIGDVRGAALTSFNMALLLLQEQRTGEALSYAQYTQEVFSKIGHQQYAEQARSLIEKIKNQMS
jgi:tetratricopeptide (TPR) repeat protein